MDALRELVLRAFPGGTVEEIRPLRDDDAADGAGATRKAAGYGIPLRIRVRDAGGDAHLLVFHTARADAYGHDRRADRVAEMILAYDTYGRIPGHVRALDVGLIGDDGALRSLAGAGEPYLVTGWAEGEVYAADLRRVAADGAGAGDLRRAEQLADYLAALHRARPAGEAEDAAAYARAVRDLIGSGEGVWGIVDGYPPDTPAAPPARLRRIEEQCLAWRWRLRGRRGRARRIHGDFHPFNLVLDAGGALRLLDASRGTCGEPADDVTALAVNFVFFALDAPGAWRRGLGALWHRFWRRYLDASGDAEVLDVAAPWLAWRALVVASPRWYPDLSAAGREALLGWIERVLSAPGLDPASADEVAP